MARTSDRRTFLQLADTYDATKHFISGWFVSEKMDGMRCYWDGGITAGMYAHTIPFANVEKDTKHVRATGLWSRRGKVIHAPLWFTDELPKYPLDGELTAGRGLFQATMSACRKHDPVDDEWERIKYRVFDLPDYSDVFMDGRVVEGNWETRFSGIVDWLKGLHNLTWTEPKRRRFETVVFLLNKHHPDDGKSVISAVRQEQLPMNGAKATVKIDELLEQYTSLGAEGLMLRHYNSIWEPQRTPHVLKVKPFEDAEVTVKGYIWGRETDKGSKLLGLMGAMICDYQGKRLELSGFTDDERKLKFVGDNPASSNEGRIFPGKEVSENWRSEQFRIGSTITIRYRELTDDGLPKEARYWRHRPAE